MTAQDGAGGLTLVAAIVHAAGFLYVGHWQNVALAIVYSIASVMLFESANNVRPEPWR